MNTLNRAASSLEQVAHWFADVPLRLFLAWEFFESGWEKFNGSNWFADLQGSFPFPFNLVPPEINWQISMWVELICPLLLLLGLGTRVVSMTLIVLTVVAIGTVHWPADWSSLAELARGYAITDQGYGNFKLPLIYLVVLLPLLLKGAGRLSLDHWLGRQRRPVAALA